MGSLNEADQTSTRMFLCVYMTLGPLGCRSLPQTAVFQTLPVPTGPVRPGGVIVSCGVDAGSPGENTRAAGDAADVSVTSEVSGRASSSLEGFNFNQSAKMFLGDRRAELTDQSLGYKDISKGASDQPECQEHTSSSREVPCSSSMVTETTTVLSPPVSSPPPPAAPQPSVHCCVDTGNQLWLIWILTG